MTFTLITSLIWGHFQFYYNINLRYVSVAKGNVTDVERYKLDYEGFECMEQMVNWYRGQSICIRSSGDERVFPKCLKVCAHSQRNSDL